MKSIVLGGLALFGGAISIGLIVGKARSPKYETLGQVQDKVELGIQVSQGLAGPSVDMPAGVILPDTLVTAVYSSGSYTYIWQNLALPIEDSLGCVALGPTLRKCHTEHLPKIARAGMNDVAWVALLAATGLPSGWQIKNIEPVIESKSGLIYVLSALGGALGFFIGYELGYSDSHDPDSKLFQDVLTDPRRWRDMVTNTLWRADPKHGVVVPGLGAQSFWERKILQSRD
jgi:hypothetical protein